MMQRQTDKLTKSLFKLPDANKKGFFISIFLNLASAKNIYCVLQLSDMEQFNSKMIALERIEHSC